MTKRKVGGYADNRALANAIQSNTDARRILQRLQARADQRRGAGWLYKYLARLAQAHSRTLEALAEMERIRNNHQEETDV
jgi:hypothetical protein